MIRNARLNGGMRSLPLLLPVMGLLLTSFPVVSRAGDQDGLGGYSMQLKRKYFDGTNSGSGGSGQALYPDPKSNASPDAPELTSVEMSQTRRMIHFYRCVVMLELRLR